MWSEKAEGVVTPVVSQTLVEKHLIVHELVDRHQFDRRDTQIGEVLDDHRMSEPRVRAAQFLRNSGVRRGHTLDVRFVDDRLVIRTLRRVVGRPIEERVDDDGRHRMAERIMLGERDGGGFVDEWFRLEGFGLEDLVRFLIARGRVVFEAHLVRFGFRTRFVGSLLRLHGGRFVVS